MPFGETVLHYDSDSWLNVFKREIFGVEPKADEKTSKIVVLYENGDIKEIVSDSINQTLLYGDMATDRDIPSYIFNIQSHKINNRYNYRYPTMGTYSCRNVLAKSAKYANATLVASRFTAIYDDKDGNPVFVLFRMQSSDILPRFVFYFDDAHLTHSHAEEIIRKILV